MVNPVISMYSLNIVGILCQVIGNLAVILRFGIGKSRFQTGYLRIQFFQFSCFSGEGHNGRFTVKSLAGNRIISISAFIN